LRNVELLFVGLRRKNPRGRENKFAGGREAIGKTRKSTVTRNNHSVRKDCREEKKKRAGYWVPSPTK